jgi:hypothetical protein
MRPIKVDLPHWMWPVDPEMPQYVGRAYAVDASYPLEPGRQKLVDDGLHDNRERLQRSRAQHDLHA